MQPTRSQFKKWITRAALIAIIACGSVSLSANATNSTDAPAEYSFDIPSLKVEEALSQLAQQTGHQLLFSYELVDSLYSAAVTGKYTVARALQHMYRSQYGDVLYLGC